MTNMNYLLFDNNCCTVQTEYNSIKEQLSYHGYHDLHDHHLYKLKSANIRIEMTFLSPSLKTN